jgi:hypothetical protein
VPDIRQEFDLACVEGSFEDASSGSADNPEVEGPLRVEQEWDRDLVPGALKADANAGTGRPAE